MNYFLYPPFFIVPEENNFADAWETFCCKLLNLKEQTDEIYRRHPPEQGIDLYFPSKQIAYQCKSVESGKSGDFNVAKVLESIKAARQVRPKVRWKEYALCTNVDITGSSEKRLRQELPNLIIKPRSYWQSLCEEFPLNVERNFRILLTVPPQTVRDTISRTFVSTYSDELKRMLDASSFDVFLYSTKNDKIYRIPVSPEFRVTDLLDILRNFFKLPAPQEFYLDGLSIGLNHSIIINGKEPSPTKSLLEAGICAGSVITYWTTFILEDYQSKFEGNVMHSALPIGLSLTHVIKGIIDDAVYDKNSSEIKETFNRLVASGVDEEDAHHFILQVVIWAMREALDSETVFDRSRFVEALLQLPQLPNE